MLDTKIEHEVGRLRALTCYAILGTPPEAPFDEICGLAAHLCETPIALVSFVEADRLWFKSRVGLAETHWPIDSAFCARTIAQPDIFIVADTLDDQRFAMSPLVTGEPYIRFYAGVPLLSPSGEAIGTLCVLDRVPRQLGALQREALSTLGRQVVAQLELRLKSMQLDRTMFAPSQAIDGLRQNGRFDQVVLSSLREYSAILELPRLPAVEKPSFAMSINQLPWPYSGAAVSHTNVAARRLAEDALRHAKERISEFFSVVPVAISITSLAEDRFIEVNEYYLQLVGFERADLIGRTSGALDLWVRPEERAVVGDRLREHPSIHDLEVDFRMRSGEVCHGLAAMEIIDLHGEPCILAMVHDITERKRAEAEIYDEGAVRGKLMELEMRFDLQEISEADYLEAEEFLLSRLKEIREYKAARAQQ
ncbi:MAG: PAS domain S-box protein [Kouleothrix sp.]|nr:PAS domain S-box protein [Kouleothrix sp.]